MGRNPTSVFWRVVAVHIDAIKFVSERLLTFVSQEILEGFPAGADCYSTSAVVSVLSRFRVIAPVSHKTKFVLQVFHREGPGLVSRF